ncbi:hypothetical protein JG687_00017628, partial [Phytophthora cactorum]
MSLSMDLTTRLWQRSDAAMTSKYCSRVVMLLTEFTTVVNRLALYRKRVAALAYIMTNRQAIAGPLAALYLYRGSCCYSSAVCASLPL